MKKIRNLLKALTIMMLIMCLITPSAALAAESEQSQELPKAEDVGISNFSILDLDSAPSSSNELIDIDNVKEVTTLEIDESKETLDVSARLRQRGAWLLENNPNIGVNGQLTTANTLDFYFFSITGGNKFMLARLISSNADYVAQLYMINNATGDATPTNIYGFAGDLIGLNGLPNGDYAIAIFSTGSVGNNYTFYMNATNPSGTIKKQICITGDLSVFVYENMSGDVYGNGTFVYNTSTMTGANFNWQRVDERRWTIDGYGGYEQRTHSVSNVKIKAVTGPAKWKSTKASSDAVMLIYCDVGTIFSFLHTYYQSAPDHTYWSSTNDTFGRSTPRTLDEADMEYSHILAFDLYTGKVIDFYSPLHFFYVGGYESAPTITFY